MALPTWPFCMDRLMDMAGMYVLHWFRTALYICLVQPDLAILSQSILVFQLVLSVFNMGFENAGGARGIRRIDVTI